MVTEPNLYNPLGWAHLQLRGGLRNTVATTAGYTLIISALIFATVRFNPHSSNRILSAWAVGMLGLQTGILLLFGCMTVGSAVRLDHTSKMIESHRLMPTSASSAILGYMFGAPCQALSMAMANFVIGAVVANSAHIALARWAMANAILVSFIVFVWVVVVFFGLLAQTAFRWIVSVFSIGFWISQGQVQLVLPGITVLVSPLLGNSIFAMRLRSTELSWEYIASAVAQLLIGTICFIGACRKYRRADTPALGADLGLVLLAAWITLSFMGIYYWDSFNPTWLGDDGDTRRRFLATMVATLLVMIIPINGAARAQVKWNHHRQVHDIVLPRRPLSPLLVALLAATMPLLLTLTLSFSRPMMIDGTIRTAIVLLCFALTISYMLRLLPLGSKSVWLVPLAWILLTFGGPIFTDLIYHSLIAESREATGILSTLSPPATLFDIWGINPIGTNLALIVQAAQAASVMVLFYVRRRPISPPLSPPSPTP
jgi:hypothetical protein